MKNVKKFYLAHQNCKNLKVYDGACTKCFWDGFGYICDDLDQSLQFLKAELSLVIKKEWQCAAKALFSCPAIISQRLEPRITSNGPLENTEEESKII